MSSFIKRKSVRPLAAPLLVGCALLISAASLHAKPVVVGSGTITGAACKADGGTISLDVKTGGFMCCWDSPSSNDVYCERCSDCKPGDEVQALRPGVNRAVRPASPVPTRPRASISPGQGVSVPRTVE